MNPPTTPNDKDRALAKRLAGPRNFDLAPQSMWEAREKWIADELAQYREESVRGLEALLKECAESLESRWENEQYATHKKIISYFEKTMKESP
jgi:hypothetical protein